MWRAHKAARVFLETAWHTHALRSAERRGRLPRDVLHGTMTSWARSLLSVLGVELRGNHPRLEEPSILVGNHLSYLDIPVLMSVAPVVFVAKRELASWWIFGPAMKSVGTVFVDRESRESRKNIGASLTPQLLEKRQSVVIFPAGTTTLHEDKPWRWGAFRLALELGIPVVPFRLRYTPARRAAFLLEDRFLPHFWSLLKERRIGAELEFHPPVRITDPERDAAAYWNWSREGRA